MPVPSMLAEAPTLSHMETSEPPNTAAVRRYAWAAVGLWCAQFLVSQSLLPQASEVCPHLLRKNSVNNQMSCKMSQCIQDSVVKCFLLCAKYMIKDTSTINRLTATFMFSVKVF